MKDMKKFITDEDLENIKPIKPKFLFWKVFLSMNLSSLMMMIFVIPFSYFLYMDTISNHDEAMSLLIGMSSFVYVFSLIFSIPMSIERRTFIPNFMLWVCGLKKYYNEYGVYDKLCDEYDNQEEYRNLKEKYENYK